jgi:preprotein translocase subunit YajC
MLLSSVAYAADAAPRGGFDIMSLLPLVIIFAIFYFMMIRPQLKKQREHQALLSTLKVGDKVITSGGIIGAISKVESDTVLQVEVAADVKIRVLRSTINEKLGKDFVEPLVSTKSKSRKKAADTETASEE